MYTEGELSKVFGAYSSLRLILQEYRLRPGEHIQVTSLSEQLRFSVTPIREALARLWIEQLVDCVPNRGYYVKQIDLVEQSLLIDAKTVILKHGIMMARSLEVPLDEPEDFSLNDRVEAHYRLFSEMTSNAEFRRAIDNYNARSYIIRKIDCDLFPSENTKFLSEIDEALKTNNRNAAVRVLVHQLQRVNKGLPLLTKEAVSRVTLRKVNPMSGFHEYAYSRRSDFRTNFR